ncbi:MAG: twin-arginine translocase TatA/TatE family subunit [Propionibacteriaceae bacterium]|nr:twin-arginine translocase TatA/TatE family subunit [Propionibacteriaceae bacterium]
MLGLPGGWEWLIILLIIVLLFGGAKIAGVGKSTGKAIREFKEELSGPDGAKPAPAPDADATSGQSTTN